MSNHESMNPSATFPIGALDIGQVISVRGSEACVGLTTSLLEQDRSTVGSLLAMSDGVSSVVGMISSITRRNEGDPGVPSHRAIATVDLIGEIETTSGAKTSFRRGVRRYPTIGDSVRSIGRDELALMHSCDSARTVSIGNLSQDRDLPAYIDADQLLSKHFAVVGSTGVGKSSGVAAIVSGLIEARPDVRVLMLDVHNEYGRIFGDRAKEIDSDNLRLPFWLLNFEEVTDVIYGGKGAPSEEVEILAELIPAAKGMYLGYQDGVDRQVIAKKRPVQSGFTADTPSPYQLQDLLSLIDDRMGKLENRLSRMAHHRLMMRIQAIRNDPRFAFMFRDAMAGGDTMAAVLCQLFSLETGSRSLSVLKLASLPDEVVDAVVCVTARLAFDFALWSDGAMPILLVCEEAHRYVSSDELQGFAPARRALKRIAREGRKYGVHLGLVTQRPAELDATILSQCSTMFAMRMTNDVDQAILRSSVSDAAANLLSFLPSLAAQEAIGIGEGMPLAARFSFRTLTGSMLPSSDTGARGTVDPSQTAGDVVRSAIDRWRRATTSQSVWADAGLGAGISALDASIAAPNAQGRTLHTDGYTPLRR